MFNQCGDIGRRATNRKAENIRDMCILRAQAELEFKENYAADSESYSEINSKIGKFSDKLGNAHSILYFSHE